MRADAAVSWPAAWVLLLLAILTFLVIYPLLTLVLGALTDSNPVVEGFGLRHRRSRNFLDVLGNPNVGVALFNTLVACGGGTVDRGGDRAGLLLDRGAHQHAVQGLHRRRPA